MKYIRTLSLALLVVFIVMRLTNSIDWNWLMVLSPVWIYAAVCLLVLIINAYLKATYPARLKKCMQRDLANASRRIREEREAAEKRNET